MRTNGRLIELLGYNINTDKMQKWCDEFYKDKTKEKLQLKYFNILYDTCINLNLIIPKKEDINFNPKENWASLTIYNELLKNEETKKLLPSVFFENFNIFSKKYCADINGFWYIDKSNDYPTLLEASNAIKNSGGIVFCAHTYIYKWINDMEKHILTMINTIGLQGIECFHSDFSIEEINSCLNFTKKYNLYISGGSDYHGTNKKNINLKIGKGNLNIDEKYILNWL